MRILRRRQHIDTVHSARTFWYEGHKNGWGFTFPCHPDGTLLPLSEPARVNYEACLTGTVDGRPVIDGGIRHYTQHSTIPATGRCRCGQSVSLDGFTNTCSCGRDYNMSGQLLAPRSQWGEETHESLADILRIP